MHYSFIGSDCCIRFMVYQEGGGRVGVGGGGKGEGGGGIRGAQIGGCRDGFFLTYIPRRGKKYNAISLDKLYKLVIIYLIYVNKPASVKRSQ